jgi:alkanesulfonate monooxygenase SsuD/methylene tetrahydromethanopterin reductase-like flavin-dependent oxidoreductase (luciferase family)
VKFGLTLPNCASGDDPSIYVNLAVEAEAAGWDGLFLWDSIEPEQGLVPDPTDRARAATYDTWVLLTAVATGTRRLRIGPMITPLPRRRPWKLARECVTLDRLSGGRLTLSVGLGDPREGGFSKVGEDMPARLRAERLDEGLAILMGLWSGEPFSYHGTHYDVADLCTLPEPLQTPRIPIWVVGVPGKVRSISRALRWDGIVMQTDGLTRDRIPAEVSALYSAHRADGGSAFDIVIGGFSGERGHSAKFVADCGEAGATWWLEAGWRYVQGDGTEAGDLVRRVRQGPPS